MIQVEDERDKVGSSRGGSAGDRALMSSFGNVGSCIPISSLKIGGRSRERVVISVGVRLKRVSFVVGDNRAGKAVRRRAERGADERGESNVARGTTKEAHVGVRRQGQCSLVLSAIPYEKYLVPKVRRVSPTMVTRYLTVMLGG